MKALLKPFLGGVMQDERTDSELSAARSIQLDALPGDFADDVFAVLRPAHDVGGDLYDFIRKGDRMSFIVCDASGRGIRSAVFSVMADTAFRMVCCMDLDAGEIAGRINQTLAFRNDLSMFATAFVGVLDVGTGDLEFVCAGQNPPVVISPDGTARFLPLHRDPPMGVLEKKCFTLQRTRLEPGSRLLAYTDGVTEATREDYAQFGDGRLLEYAATCKGCGVREIVNGLLETVAGFVEGDEQADDIAIMAIGC